MDGTEAQPLNKYRCARCGYEYKKSLDYEPYLCYRCMRFIAKRVWTVIVTITPPRRPDVGDI